MAPSRNSGLVSLIANVPLPRNLTFIHYIRHLLTHFVDMSYINSSCSVQEFKEELENKQRMRMRIKSRLCHRTNLHSLSAPLAICMLSIAFLYSYHDDVSVMLCYQVTKKVGDRKSSQGYRQAVQTVSSLTKNLYFFPGYAVRR